MIVLRRRVKGALGLSHIDDAGARAAAFPLAAYLWSSIETRGALFTDRWLKVGFYRGLGEHSQ